MTLIELLKQIRGIEFRMVTTEGIPLKMYGKSCAVELQLCGDNGNYWVEVRPSIDYDEKVAIIMQMFEEGNSDSIAMAVANQIKQGVIDKACEWLRNNMEYWLGDYNLAEDELEDNQMHYSAMLEALRKAMEE